MTNETNPLNPPRTFLMMKEALAAALDVEPSVLLTAIRASLDLRCPSHAVLAYLINGPPLGDDCLRAIWQQLRTTSMRDWDDLDLDPLELSEEGVVRRYQLVGLRRPANLDDHPLQAWEKFRRTWPLQHLCLPHLPAGKEKNDLMILLSLRTPKLNPLKGQADRHHPLIAGQARLMQDRVLAWTEETAPLVDVAAELGLDGLL